MVKDSKNITKISKKTTKISNSKLPKTLSVEEINSKRGIKLCQ